MDATKSLSLETTVTGTQLADSLTTMSMESNEATSPNDVKSDIADASTTTTENKSNLAEANNPDTTKLNACENAEPQTPSEKIATNVLHENLDRTQLPADEPIPSDIRAQNILYPDEKAAILALNEAAKKEGFKVSPLHLAQYVIVCKKDIEKALARMRKLDGLIKQYDLSNVNVDEAMKRLTDKGVFHVAGVTACKKGVLGMSYSNFLVDEWSTDEQFRMLAAGFLEAMDLCQSTLDTVRSGVVFAAQCKGIGWKNFSLEMEKKFTAFYQDGHPMKVAGVMLFDPPMVIKVMMKLMTPFLKKKLRERIGSYKSSEIPGVHTGSNVKHVSAKNYMHGIHTDITPPALGGTYERGLGEWLKDARQRRSLAERVLLEQLPEL